MWPEPDAEQEQRIFRTSGGNAAFHNFANDYGHIQDPNKRRRLALSEIDKVPFGWYHVRAVSVAGIGFFTDSYDIFAINLVLDMLGLTFYQSTNGTIPKQISTAIKASLSGGTVIGQVVFGLLADVLGRRKMYGIELITIIVATVAQSLTSPSTSMSMTGLLIFWRVIMGIGIGGDYPMSAVITSEFAPTRWRGTMMAAVFSMQGAGQFAAAIVALLVTIGFRDSFTAKSFSMCGTECQVAADRCWRIIIGAGALPAIFALYYRITIPETPRYTFDVAQDIEQGSADIKAFTDGKSDGHPDAIQRERTKLQVENSPLQPRASWADFCKYFGQWKNGSLLFATMSSWFFLDLAFYGLGLNNSIVLSNIGYADSPTSVYHKLFNTAVGNLIIVCAGSLPGYWLSVIFMDSLGRRTIQIWGFGILTVLFCIIGFAYQSLNQASLLGLYVLAQLFFNFGPNATTFIVPGECFPTRYRATGHGLAAASGKVGAIIAQIVSYYLLQINQIDPCPAGYNLKDCTPFIPHLMEIFACFMLCGTLISFLIPETKLRTLEELAGEKPFSLRNSSVPPTPRIAGFLTPYLSPIIPPLRSPRIEPKNGSSSHSLMKGEKGNRGHNRMTSHDNDIGPAASIDGRSRLIGDPHSIMRSGSDSARSHSRSIQYPASVNSEGAILVGHERHMFTGALNERGLNRMGDGQTSPTNTARFRSDSDGESSRYMMDHIPLQDVGGLVFKNAII